MNRSPTRLPRILAVVALLALVLTVARSGPPPAQPDESPQLPAGGIASHLGYFDTPYRDARKAATGVKLLEAKMVRDGVAPFQRNTYYERIYAAFRAVAAESGAKFLLGAGRADQSVTAQLDAFTPLVADGIVWGIEGANEWDNVVGRTEPRWAEQLRAHTRELHRQVKARWPGMPVVGPSLSFKTGEYVGDLSAHMDYGNVHYYGSVEKGIDLRDLDERIANARLVSGTKPLWATEANGIVGDGYVDTEEEQARMMRTLYRLLGERGVQRVFSYELVNGSRPKYSATHRENNFGSYKLNSLGNWETKPVYFEILAANRRG